MHVRPTGATIGALTLALALVLAGCGSGGTAPTTAPAAPSQLAPTGKPALGALASLTLSATVDGLSSPVSIVATNDTVWVIDHAASRLIRIDPATDTITANVAVGTGYSNGLGVAGGRLWTFNQTGGAILAVDPKTAKVVETVRVGGDGDIFAVGDDAAWLITGGELARVDGKTAEVTKHPVPSPCVAAGLAVGGGFAWIASEGGDVCKIDEKTGALVQRATGLGRGNGLAIVGGAPWLPGGDDGLAIIDGTTLAVAAAIPPPAAGSFEGSTYSLGRATETAFVTGADDGRTGWLRYTGATIARVDVGATPALVLYAGFPADILGAGVREAFGSLWVANFGAGSVQRFDLPTR